jgi:alpha-tubulin suppressor-like RCC1 family protein
VSSKVASIALGADHTCAVTTSGAAKCWGKNDAGQLGNNSTTNSSTPVQVLNLSANVASISAGGLHTCAVTTGGAAKCWGHNVFNQLGNASTIPSSLVPVAVVGLSSGIKSVAAGGTHTCAVTTDNRVKCWGDNENGRLGDGTTVQKDSPIDVFVEAW